MKRPGTILDRGVQGGSTGPNHPRGLGVADGCSNNGALNRTFQGRAGTPMASIAMGFARWF